MLGNAASISFSACSAWYTTPPVQPCVAAGIETAIVTFSSACALPSDRGMVKATVDSKSAVFCMIDFMFSSF